MNIAKVPTCHVKDLQSHVKEIAGEIKMGKKSKNIKQLSVVMVLTKLTGFCTL